MPKIEKSEPVFKGASREIQPLKTGSILSRAVDVRTLVEKHIKMLLYGRNRTGKTHLVGDFPKPLLLISMEPSETGGATTIAGREGIKFLNMRYEEVDGKLIDLPSENVVALGHELKEWRICDLPGQPKYHGKLYQTIAFDSVTSLEDVLLKEILGLSAVPDSTSWGIVSRDAYKLRAEKIKEYLRPYVDLRGVNMIFVAKEKDHNPPKETKDSKGANVRDKATRLQGMVSDDLTQEPFFNGRMGESVVDWLQDACGYLCQLYVTLAGPQMMEVAGTLVESLEGAEKTVRRLRTKLHQNYGAGFRSAKPSCVPEYIEEPTWDKIRAVIDGDWDPSRGCKLSEISKK